MELDILVLDHEFTLLGIIDVYQSLSWTERYQEAGDMELVVPATEAMIDLIKLDRFVIMKASPKLVVIEEITIESNAQEGNRMIVKGRTFEAVLERRIVWYRVNGTGQKTKVNLQDAILKMVRENAVEPSDPRRKIPNLFIEISVDPNVTQHFLMEDHWGDNLYTLICNECKHHNIGWRINPNALNGLVFELYYGENRSWNQVKNPWIVFSPSFDNFLNSNYYLTKNSYVTDVLGVGPKERSYSVTIDGDGVEHKVEKIGENIVVSVTRKESDDWGLDRRELAIDCTDITSFPDDQVRQGFYPRSSTGGYQEPIYSPESLFASIRAQMTEKCQTALNDTVMTEAFDGQIETTNQFQYGRDYFLGDVVQIQNGFGMEKAVRLVEVLITYDASGYNYVPTFADVSEEETHKDGNA